MSSLSHVQFKDAMSANEIRANVQIAPGKEDSAKLSEEAYKSGLGGQIKKDWVNQPLTIWHQGGVAKLADGHHRLAVAEGIDPNRPIPVRHQYRQ
jgi:hypothetical protein